MEIHWASWSSGRPGDSAGCIPAMRGGCDQPRDEDAVRMRHVFHGSDDISDDWKSTYFKSP